MPKMSRTRWAEAVLAVALAAMTGFISPSVRAQSAPTDDPDLLVPNQSDDKGEFDQDDPTARLQWERETFGLTTPEYRSTAIKEGKKHNDKKNAPGPKWVSIGPTGADYEQNGSFTGHVRDSGRARAILPHPTNPEVVYVLTSGGGLWRTNNWSSPNTSWTSLTDDLPTTGGGSVAFGKNPNTLYLGLGDPYDQILVGGSIVKSKDGGVNWSPMIELGNAVGVRDVKVDTSTNRDIVFVATDNGVYRSADDGATYNAVPTFAGMSAWSFARTSAGWLASAQPCAAASVGLQCGGATTLFLSTDKGATWAPISNAGNVFASNGRTTLAVAVPGDNVVYAYSSTVGDGAMRDVYRSSDGGQTWVANGVNSTKIPTNPVPGASNQPNMNICGGQCWYNQMILVDPTDATRNTVWIGGNLATAKTTNGGGSWTLKTWWLYSQVPTLPYAHADHHASAFKTTGTPTIILGNDGGFDISTDGGVSFSSDKNNGLVTHLYYTVAGNASLPNVVIGGLQDNGTRLRTDNGTIHNQVIGGDGMGAAFSQANTNTSLGSSQGSGMRTNLSNNEPIVYQNWASATSGLSDFSFGFFTAIVPAPANLDPTGRVFYHFSGTRIWKTINGGLTWTRIAAARASTGVTISPGFPADGSRSFRSSPYDLAIGSTDLNHIAIGAAGGFLDISTNGGANWTDLNLISLVPGYQGFVTNVAWEDNNTVWVTSVAQASGSLRVLKGTAPWTAASNWVAKQNGLPDLPVTRVYFDAKDASHKTIYAATHVGIYQTTDGGDNWAPYGNGLPTVRVNDIYMPPDGSFMRIATYGRGIWELSQLELASAKIADDATSCDHDGVLDDGETGHLTVTLASHAPNNVNQISIVVTSTNPHVSFPDGNVLSFPPVQKFGSSTGSIKIALNGATGIETSNLSLAISAPELGLPPFNVTSTERMNYNDAAASSATETVESSNPGWTAGGDDTTMPNILSWQRRTLSPTQHVWFGPDNNGQTDGVKTDLPDTQTLTSPALHVGSDPLVVKFSHRFSFEFDTNGAWDGGVVEISTNGGTTWTDIGTTAYNGQMNAFTSSSIGAGHKAFINRNTGWPGFSSVTLNLGNAYANQDVQIRFRVGADESTGAPGWDVDDIQVTGVTGTPFSSLVPQPASCTP